MKKTHAPEHIIATLCEAQIALLMGRPIARIGRKLDIVEWKRQRNRTARITGPHPLGVLSASAVRLVPPLPPATDTAESPARGWAGNAASTENRETAADPSPDD